VSALPNAAEVADQLQAMAKAGYSADARRKASEWGAPLLIDAEMQLLGDTSGLSRALFLLGAADLVGNHDGFLYEAADFESALEALENDDFR
jgi:hypothetical protein